MAPGTQTSQASGAAAGGRKTLATKHASRGHLHLPWVGTDEDAGRACDRARSSPFFLGEVGGLGDLGGAVAVGGAAGGAEGRRAHKARVLLCLK